MQSNDRVYFSRRSVEEIHAAMRAESIEATNAHVGLAELHLRRCAGCVRSVTEECGHCLAVNICLRPDVARDAIVRRGSPDVGDRTAPPAFSQQERQILKHIARGLSAREVGDLIGTAARKVERRIDTMRAKLRARNAAHLVTRAIVDGVLTLPI